MGCLQGRRGYARPPADPDSRLRREQRWRHRCHVADRVQWRQARSVRNRWSEPQCRGESLRRWPGERQRDRPSHGELQSRAGALSRAAGHVWHLQHDEQADVHERQLGAAATGLQRLRARHARVGAPPGSSRLRHGASNCRRRPTTSPPSWSRRATPRSTSSSSIATAPRSVTGRPPRTTTRDWLFTTFGTVPRCGRTRRL